MVNILNCFKHTKFHHIPKLYFLLLLHYRSGFNCIWSRQKCNWVYYVRGSSKTRSHRKVIVKTIYFTPIFKNWISTKLSDFPYIFQVHVAGQGMWRRCIVWNDTNRSRRLLHIQQQQQQQQWCNITDGHWIGSDKLSLVYNRLQRKDDIGRIA